SANPGMECRQMMGLGVEGRANGSRRGPLCPNACAAQAPLAPSHPTPVSTQVESEFASESARCCCFFPTRTSGGWSTGMSRFLGRTSGRDPPSPLLVSSDITNALEIYDGAISVAPILNICSCVTLHRTDESS